MSVCSFDIDNKVKLSPEMFSQVGEIYVRKKLKTQKAGFHQKRFQPWEGYGSP